MSVAVAAGGNGGESSGACDLAISKITPEVLSNLAYTWNEAKTLLLNFSPFDSDAVSLENEFQASLDNALTSLNTVLGEILDENQTRVVVMLTKNKIMDDINQLLVRIAGAVDANFGEHLESMRSQQSEIVHALRDELIALEESKADSDHHVLKLKEALTQAETNCKRLADATARLNTEADEQNAEIRRLKHMLNHVKDSVSAPRPKDRSRKSALETRERSRVLTNKSVGEGGVDSTLTLPDGLASSGPQSARLTTSMLKAHNSKLEQQQQQQQQMQQSNGHAGEQIEIEPIPLSKTGTAALLGVKSSQAIKAEEIANKMVTEAAASSSSGKRADSSLEWLKRFRSEVQAREDTNIANKKILSYNNCLATIKHIYTEKEKFEQKVANVKAQNMGRRQSKGGGSPTSSSFSNAHAPPNGSTAASKNAYPPQETLERFLYRMLDKRFGYRKLSVDHAATLLASLVEYSPRDHNVAVFRATLQREVDESFPAVVVVLKESIENLVMAKIQANEPNRGHQYYKRVFHKKTTSGRLSHEEWTKIIEYLYDEYDADDLARRVLETSVQSDVEGGVLSEHAAFERLRPPEAQLLQPDHKGRLGYARRPDPSDLVNHPSPHSVDYGTLVNLCCLYQLEKRIKAIMPIRNLFDTFDKDHDGILNRREFAAFLRELGVELLPGGSKFHKGKGGAQDKSAKYRRKAGGVAASGGHIVETVFSFTEDKSAPSKDSIDANGVSVLEGTDLSTEINRRLMEADPFRIDRITFSTAVEHYVGLIPNFTL